MNPLSDMIARHYTLADLSPTLLAALDERAGLTAETLFEQLGAVDEFHVGGRAATTALAAALQLRPGQSVLDIGCGLGGTARLLATRHKARVTGIDLTAAYVELGTILNARLGLSGQITLLQGDALALPFAARGFDAATMLHVGMNIADKAALFGGIARTLKPGGTLAIYDIMRTGEGALTYPLPWAGTAAMSFVAPPSAYRQALAAAGFAVTGEVNRQAEALAFFASLKAHAGPTLGLGLGLPLLMGDDAPQKFANLSRQIEAGLIAPVQLLARLP